METSQAQLDRIQATIEAQREVIAALVEAAERHMESGLRLGIQHLAEQRTARLHQAERVLRSVIEALDGALCIVGADGTVLDANGRWLHQLLPYTHPNNGGAGCPAAEPVGADPAAGADPTAGADPAAGTIGTDFFAWCRTARGMNELLARAAVLVREVIGADEPPSATGDTVIRGGTDRSVKGRVGPDGFAHWFVVRVHAIRDHHTARAVVTVIDITEGMRVQEQLHQATEETKRLALVARATDSAVVITLPDGTIEWVNAPFTRRTGYSLAEVTGRRRRDLVHGLCRDSAEFVEFLARLDSGRGADGEFSMASRHGERYWADIQVRPVLDGDRLVHLVWVEQDVTIGRETKQRLREAITRSEQLAAALNQEKTLLTGVISAIPQLVFWKDGLGRYVGCNTAYVAFRGLDAKSDLLGRDENSLGLDDAMARALRELEPRVIATGDAIVNRKVDLTDSQGDVRAMLLSVLPFQQDADAERGVIGVGADITHARELERHVAQANRLESIGRLAAGIAHEINTPIQYVSDNTRFIADGITALLEAAQQVAALAADGSSMARVKEILAPLDLEFLSEEMPGALAECREGLARVTQIVRAMKEYAHPGIGRADIDVNRAIESTVQVCRNEWKYIAQVRLDLAPDAGYAPCFEGELKQVVLNMIVNAAQAIEEGHTRRHDTSLGNITISTRRELDDLVITIADDGPGMEERVSCRVFDPFFTTKEVGKGTGQGLSLAHAVIVTKHGGRIHLDTAPGRGASFALHLPLRPPEHIPDQATEEVCTEFTATTTAAGTRAAVTTNETDS